MLQKLKENLPMIAIAAVGVFTVFVILFVMFKKDHVVEDSNRVIGSHVYQRVYTNGKTHLVDDPQCTLSDRRDYQSHDCYLLLHGLS